MGHGANTKEARERNKLQKKQKKVQPTSNHQWKRQGETLECSTTTEIVSNQTPPTTSMDTRTTPLTQNRQITPENDPRRFHATVEDASDEGEPQPYRSAAATETESQQPTEATNSNNTETPNTSESNEHNDARPHSDQSQMQAPPSRHAAVVTEHMEAKNDIDTAISRVSSSASSTSESYSCSTCTHRTRRSVGSFIYPAFPAFPVWESSPSLRARGMRDKNEHKNKHENETKNGTKNRLRTIVSRITLALEERLVSFKEKRKEKRAQKEKAKQEWKEEVARRYTSGCPWTYNDNFTTFSEQFDDEIIFASILDYLDPATGHPLY